MNIEIIPVAEASVSTLMKGINKVIINPIIYFLFAIAVVYFLYGLAQYLLSPDNEEVNQASKKHMLWGIIGLFIMMSVFGIMQLISNTIGANNVQIQDSGEYRIQQ